MPGHVAWKKRKKKNTLHEGLRARQEGTRGSAHSDELAIVSRDLDGIFVSGGARLRRAKTTKNAPFSYPCSTQLFHHQANIVSNISWQITPPGSFDSSPPTPPPTDRKTVSNIRSILNGFQSHYRCSRSTPWLVYSLRREKYENVLQLLKSDTDLDRHIKCKVRLV